MINKFCSAMKFVSAPIFLLTVQHLDQSPQNRGGGLIGWADRDGRNLPWKTL